MVRGIFLYVSLVLSFTTVSASSCNGSYYPSFNGTYENVTDGFNVGYLVGPNFPSGRCIESPVFNPNYYYSEVFANKSMSVPDAVSAYYQCDNFGNLSFITFNDTSCENEIIEGTMEVPVLLDGLYIDCVCEESGKYIIVENFYNESSPIDSKQCIDSKPDIAQMMSGTCFGYYDDLIEKSLYITCDDNDEAMVLEFNNSLSCSSLKQVGKNNTYSDTDCVIDGKSSWKFSCSGGVASSSKSDTKFTIAADDVIFLLIAFFYLIFVIVLLSVMFCYMTGKICVKKNKVGPEPDMNEDIPTTEAVPIEQKILDDTTDAITEKQQEQDQQQNYNGDGEGQPVENNEYNVGENNNNDDDVGGGEEVNNGLQDQNISESLSSGGGGGEEIEQQSAEQMNQVVEDVPITNAEEVMVTNNNTYESSEAEPPVQIDNGGGGGDFQTDTSNVEENAVPLETSDDSQQVVVDEDPTVIEEGAGAI